MRKHILIIFLMLGSLFSQSRSLPADTAVVTYHNVTVNRSKIDYSASTGTQPIWNDDGKPIAYVHYTYYERLNVKNKENRPIMISFNGGPGSGSVWMHLAYTGPMILNVDDEGFPVQPYGVKKNPHSIIDVADIVFVNPVNTGYSRIIDKDVKRDKFFGVNADIAYLAEWINTFIQRVNRWESPKYLIGESYGTTRVSGLAHALQNRQWMYLNGVILVSPTELGIDTGQGRRSGPLGAALRLPYFTAAAWYHKKLDVKYQMIRLLDVLDQSEKYAMNELLPVLAKGGYASEAEKLLAATKMAEYSGLSLSSVIQNNLDIPTRFFWKDLLRDQGKTIGRLDSRYLGIDRKDAGVGPDYSAELTSWLHSFTPAINHYIRTELNFSTDIKYNMFGPVRPWNNDNDNTREDLRRAMAENPYLKVLFQSGYYDGATTYFNAKYTMWQVDPSGKMKDRFSFKGYRSGHMMYLRNEDLIKANDDLRSFIQASLSNGKAAKY